MDDIYKAAVRDWAGLRAGVGGPTGGSLNSRWGARSSHKGGGGPRRGPVQLSAQAFKGMVDWAFQFRGVEGVRGSGSGEELLGEEEVPAFSIMSAPVSKCL